VPNPRLELSLLFLRGAPHSVVNGAESLSGSCSTSSLSVASVADASFAAAAATEASVSSSSTSLTFS